VTGLVHYRRDLPAVTLPLLPIRRPQSDAFLRTTIMSRVFKKIF